MGEENPWDTIPLKRDSKIRIINLKRQKPNREKGEHFMETLDDVMRRLLDFWDEHHEA